VVVTVIVALLSVRIETGRRSSSITVICIDSALLEEAGVEDTACAAVCIVVHQIIHVKRMLHWQLDAADHIAKRATAGPVSDQAVY
jgi:hypothetical protein